MSYLHLRCFTLATRNASLLETPCFFLREMRSDIVCSLACSDFARAQPPYVFRICLLCSLPQLVFFSKCLVFTTVAKQHATVVHVVFAVCSRFPRPSQSNTQSWCMLCFADYVWFPRQSQSDTQSWDMLFLKKACCAAR